MMSFLPKRIEHVTIAHFQLTELVLADGSAGSKAKHEVRYGKEQKHQPIHQPAPLGWNC